MTIAKKRTENSNLIVMRAPRERDEQDPNDAQQNSETGG